MKRFVFQMNRVVPVIIAAVLLLGAADSTYLAMRDFGILDPPPELAASSCPFAEGAACDVALESPDSSILGLSSAVIGAAYFVALLGAAIVRIAAGRWLLPWIMLPAFLLGLAYSAYLAYLMFAVLDAVCPYCMVAHCLNAIAFALFVVSLVVDRRGIPRACCGN